MNPHLTSTCVIHTWVSQRVQIDPNSKQIYFVYTYMVNGVLWRLGIRSPPVLSSSMCHQLLVSILQRDLSLTDFTLCNTKMQSVAWHCQGRVRERKRENAKRKARYIVHCTHPTLLRWFDLVPLCIISKWELY